MIRLAVILIADQFRYDYLTLLDQKFLNSSFVYTNCHHKYIPTFTAVGHATILTGVPPRIHGIISNFPSVEDPEFGKSPRRLRYPTVGDELKLKYPKSKVVSISLKDRSAIFSGGFLADVVLWLEDGKLTTSRYYRKPEWLDEINGKYSLKDKFFEGNRFLLEVFKEVLRREGLGKDTFPDLAILSLSSLDLVGHKYGPNSDEVRRVVKQVDTVIREILRFLDKEVGKGNYILIFTSDHGVAPIPKNFGGYVDEKKLGEEIREILGMDVRISYPWVFLNRKEASAKKAIKEYLLGKEWIFRVYTDEEVLSLNPKDFIDSLIINGFDGSADLVFIAKPYWVVGYPRGTTHGSPYSYDTHVPLVVYGLKKGKSQESCYITKVAEILREAFNLP